MQQIASLQAAVQLVLAVILLAFRSNYFANIIWQSTSAACGEDDCSQLIMSCVCPVIIGAGLFLPTSDLDLVIVNSGCRDVRGGLRALANALTRKGMAKQMQVGPHAAVLHWQCHHPLASCLDCERHRQQQCTY